MRTTVLKEEIKKKITGTCLKCGFGQSLLLLNHSSSFWLCCPSVTHREVERVPVNPGHGSGQEVRYQAHHSPEVQVWVSSFFNKSKEFILSEDIGGTSLVKNLKDLLPAIIDIQLIMNSWQAETNLLIISIWSC